MHPNKIFLLTLVLSMFMIQNSDIFSHEKGIFQDEGCSTVLAAGNATSDGTIIIAKNRDLSEYEIQWLYRAPRKHYPAGAYVKLQYIEIPQVEVTWAWVGSKSYTKKWGVGMGINEWGVVVADNDAPTREPLKGERGLHDNDICRLILERSKTAKEGIRVAGGLLEEYGHSFVGEIYWISDPEEAWIFEGAGHHWAAVRITDGIAVRANQFQITTHWDAGSEDLIEYAVNKGWCKSAKDFNFAKCYSKRGYPYQSSQTRVDRVHDLIDDRVGNLTKEDLMGILADHYEGTYMYETAHTNPDYRTICSKRTVSAMVSQLKPNVMPEMQVMWYCMSSPCIGVFMPVYANVSVIPVPYLTGAAPEDVENYNPDSAWWVFKKIQLLVDENYDDRHTIVREVWDELYTGFVSDISQLEKELQSLYLAGENKEAHSKIDSFTMVKLTESYNLALQTIEELKAADEGVEKPSSGIFPENVSDKQDKKIFLYLSVFTFMLLIAGGMLLYVKKVVGGIS